MVIEKHTLAAAAFLITSTLAAQSSSLTPVEQAQAFATCAGRFSAVATRQNAEHDPGFEVSRRMEHSFEALLEATLPFAADAGVDPTEARHWRVAGWKEMAHRMRMQQSAADLSHADRAARDMNRRLTTCRRMIL
ncbi:MAG: hypothetical protein AAFW87_11920 [Pseudomonadota bacterium]